MELFIALGLIAFKVALLIATLLLLPLPLTWLERKIAGHIQQRIVWTLRVVEGRALETNLLRAPAKPAGGSRREFCTLKT